MSLYAIGDLHLSFTTNKPMDVFGPRWENHVEKLREGFSALTAEDVCVICGDVSWGMDLAEAREDFRFIENLPGRKIILKGNHDLWWTSMKKMTTFLEENGFETISFLHNNAYFYGDSAAICGTRGWFYEESKGAAHDKKMIDREVLRLEASLKAGGDRDKYVFLHYPPRYGDSYVCREITELLRAYGVKECYYGHLHGPGHRAAVQGWVEGADYHLVSADYLGFEPRKIRD